MPCQAERKTAIHAAPVRTEDRRIYRRLYQIGWKTAVYKGSLPHILQATLGMRKEGNNNAMPSIEKDDNNNATLGMKKDDNNDVLLGMKEDEHNE